MAGVVYIRNKSNEDRSVFFDGKQIVLGGFEELPVDSSTARKFMEVHNSHIEIMDVDSGVGGVSSVEFKPQTMWIANITGNPDAPEQLQERRYDKLKQTFSMDDIHNPYRVARTLSYKQKGEEVWVLNEGQYDSYYNPPRAVTISPYKCVEVPYAFGEWIIQRAMGGSIGGHMEVMNSRQLPEWRPTGKWSIAELRCYLEMCRPSLKRASFGETEEQIKVKYKNAKERELRLAAVKLGLLKRIFFCMVDPNIPLPSQEDFKLRMASPEAWLDKKEIDSAAELLAGDVTSA